MAENTDSVRRLFDRFLGWKATPYLAIGLILFFFLSPFLWTAKRYSSRSS